MCKRTAAKVAVVRVRAHARLLPIPLVLGPHRCWRQRPSATSGWMDVSTLTFSLRSDVASKDAGGSIATSAGSCSRWFWNMSRSTPTLVVVAGAVSDAHVLRHGDLHMVDVVAVPERLEDRVGEARHQDVLHGLLAEVVIDAVDLALPAAPRGPARSASARRPGRCQKASR